MIYRSSNIRFNRQKYLSFWTIFCTFIPLTTQKIKILKIFWRYYHFTHVYQKSWSYATLFLRYGVWQMQLLFFILDYFFPFYPLKSKFFKNEKNTWRYHHFKYVYQNLWSDDVWFLRYGARWTGIQMDRKSGI